MTSDDRLYRDARDLVRTCRTVVAVPGVDLAELAGYCVRLDQFSTELATKGRLYEESAAWCRLASGLLRGEDVPDSIHVPAGENPADTARWQKWRLS